MYANNLLIVNEGSEIDLTKTTFWKSRLNQKGEYFLSLNAGVARLLIPDIEVQYVPEMLTGKLCVLSRGPCPQLQTADAIELLFDDHSNSPFSIQLDGDYFVPKLAVGEANIELTLSLWTREGCVGRMPARYRRASHLPCLAPWKESTK